MSNARDDRDRTHNRKGKGSGSILTASEEIGQMHFSTENYSTAIEYFQEALKSSELKDYPDRYRLYLRLCDCHRKKGNYRDARKLLKLARALLSDPAPADALGKIEYREAHGLLVEGRYEQALKLGFSAYRRLKHSSEHSEVAYIQLLLANCYQRLGLVSEAEDFFMDSLSSYRRIEDRVGIAYVYNSLGLLHKNACRWNRALASMSKALELSKSLGLSQHLIRVEINLGVVYAKLRRFSEALSAFASAASMAERFGDQDKLTKAVLSQGRTYTLSGEHCKAEKYILRGQAMANEFGYSRESALADEFLGELMIARGRPEDALVNLENGLVKAKEIAPEGDVASEVLRRIADVHLILNNIDESVASVKEGLEIAEICGEFYEIGYFHRTKAQCLRRLGDSEGAIASFKASVEAFTKYGNEYEKLCSQRMLGRYLLKSRNEKSLLQARQLLSESALGFGQIDESSEQMRAQLLLAIAEERLGNLDESLLAIYEVDRLADELQETRLKRMLPVLRARVEGKMTHDTQRVLEQIPMVGVIQNGSRSREKLVSGLGASLRLMVGKLGGRCGFVAIPKGIGKRLEVVCRENLSSKEARAILAWHLDRTEGEAHESLTITDAEQEPNLEALRGAVKGELGTLVFQDLGFENESLGVIFIHHDKVNHAAPIGQEALHFVGAYSRLISLSVYELIREERRKEVKPKPTSGFENIVTDNIGMIKLLNLAERVAHSNATVLLQGETGTGKGLIAYAVHLLSDRREKRFVHINCAAMPESLLESELFGHVKGSFTGATSDKAGLLREAHGGTIFLDEIGKTTLSMQGKLLQFLDSNKVRKVGSNELLPVDVRVICASKADLMALCNEGRFLEDFFYRINDFPLTVPPLRQRKEDIQLLFFHYLKKFAREMGKNIADVNDEALERLMAFHWPGNVRELEKVVKRAVILADDGETLDLSHLPPELVSSSTPSPGNGGSTLREQIHQLESREIRAALERNAWNKSRAAIDLGVSYPSLLSKIKRYGIRSY